MKVTALAVFLATVVNFGTSQVFAQSPQECGMSGEIKSVTISADLKTIVGIPPQCNLNRENNWAAAPPEAGLTSQAICDKARNPKDYYKAGDPPIKHKNMSACFCYTGELPNSGAQTKCWTFYDLDS